MVQASQIQQKPLTYRSKTFDEPQIKKQNKTNTRITTHKYVIVKLLKAKAKADILKQKESLPQGNNNTICGNKGVLMAVEWHTQSVERKKLLSIKNSISCKIILQK